MKKQLAMGLALCLLLNCLVLPAKATSAQENEAEIYTFLTQTMGLNTAAACGVLANLRLEVGPSFDPDTRQTSFGSVGEDGTPYGAYDDSAGYGLCQWAYCTRKLALKEWCEETVGPDSYRTIYGQLMYMWQEMKTGYGCEGYKTFYQYLKNGVEDSPEGTYAAAYQMCCTYEQPYYYNKPYLDFETGSDYRGDYAVTNYWTVYGDPNWTPAPQEIHFPRTGAYTQGQFTDVSASQWYTKYVAEAVELGLMKGNGDKTFAPQGNVTIAEAITMAARIHSIYTTGSESFQQTSGTAWYQVYLDYAYKNGIIDQSCCQSDVTQEITRAQYAEIFANALPDDGLEARNTVADNAIPDVPSSKPYADAVYKLYRAGILAGNDGKGTFAPQSNMTRAESAAVVSRMADTDNRLDVTLN